MYCSGNFAKFTEYLRTTASANNTISLNFLLFLRSRQIKCKESSQYGYDKIFTELRTLKHFPFYITSQSIGSVIMFFSELNTAIQCILWTSTMKRTDEKYIDFYLKEILVLSMSIQFLGL